MKRSRATAAWLCAVSVMALNASAGDAPTAKDILGLDDAPNSPVRPQITLTSASMKDGIQLRAVIHNSSTQPYRLEVCPHMLMCFVKGLHPLIAYDGTGKGLLDLCKASKPSDHEVLLPANADFAFDVPIPADRLPEQAKVKGKDLSVFLCYELGDGKLVHSNVLKVSLAE